MKKNNGEEIIAYRIGQALYCSECYEKGAKELKAGQDPSEPEVKFPSKPIKAKDITIFICEDCLAVKGPRAEELMILRSRDDPLATVEHCIRKIGLLRDFLSPPVPIQDLFSKNGEAGFHHVLADIEDDLELALYQLLQKTAKGLIHDKKRDEIR